MYDYDSCHMIEALRSGVPSREVGRCFTEARAPFLREMNDAMEDVKSSGKSKGIVFTGKYGEGKTHLLETMYSMAEEQNMVVSYLSLSKEAPFDKPYMLYQKLLANTSLPHHDQPGVMDQLFTCSAGSNLAKEMLLFASRELETDKLYYLFNLYLNSEDTDARYQMAADLEGDFMSNETLKQLYSQVMHKKIKYNTNFVKTKHMNDYFSFLSHLFLQMGYDGWVVLFDEAELIGRLGRKTRAKAYRNMATFLDPGPSLEKTFTLFAFSDSYQEEVIVSRNEEEEIKRYFLHEGDDMLIPAALNAICKAKRLPALTENDICGIIEKIILLHGKAYGWNPTVSAEQVTGTIQSHGFLLRTKIRSAIEYLDQLYQYGNIEEATIGKLQTGDISESEEQPSLDSLLDEK